MIEELLCIQLSEANRVATTIGVMDRSLRDDLGTWHAVFTESDGPLVPDLRVGVVAPDLHLDLLTLAHDDRHPNREVEWEPRLHAWGVLARVDTVEDILVELGCEVASESMNLSLRLLHREIEAAVLAH